MEVPGVETSEVPVVDQSVKHKCIECNIQSISKHFINLSNVRTVPLYKDPTINYDKRYTLLKKIKIEEKKINNLIWK